MLNEFSMLFLGRKCTRLDTIQSSSFYCKARKNTLCCQKQLPCTHNIYNFRFSEKSGELHWQETFHTFHTSFRGHFIKHPPTIYVIEIHSHLKRAVSWNHSFSFLWGSFEIHTHNQCIRFIAICHYPSDFRGCFWTSFVCLPRFEGGT